MTFIVSLIARRAVSIPYCELNYCGALEIGLLLKRSNSLAVLFLVL